MLEHLLEIEAEPPPGNTLGAVVICLLGRYILGSAVAAPAGPPLPATPH